MLQANTNENSNKIHVTIFFIILGCYLFILNLFLLYDESTYQWDSFIYLKLAESLYYNKEYLLDGFLHSFHPPGFPILISLFMYVTNGDSLLASKILMFSNSFLLSFVMYHAAHHLLRKKLWAIFSVTLFMLTYRNQFGLFWVQPENILSTLYTFLIYLFLFKRKWSLNEYLAIPLLAALSCYLKPESVLFLAITLGYSMYIYRWGGVSKKSICSFLAFTFIMLPLVIHNYSITGRPSISGKGGAIVQWAAIKQQGGDPSYQWKATLAEQTTDKYKFTFGEFYLELSKIDYQSYSPEFKSILRRITVDILESMYKYLGVMLTLFFCYGIFSDKNPLKKIYICFAVYIVIICFLYFENRFIIPWLPLLYIMAFHQLVDLSLFVSKKFQFQPKQVFFLFLFLSTIFCGPFLYFITGKKSMDPSIALANDFMYKDRMVLVNEPSYDVLLDKNKIYLIPNKLQLTDLKEIKANNEVGYIIVNNWNNGRDKCIGANLIEMKTIFQKVEVLIYGKVKILFVEV